jgi:hypothetical protein
VDFVRLAGASSPWVMGHVRTGKADVVAEIQSAGFQLIEENLSLLRDNYFLRFRKLADG